MERWHYAIIVHTFTIRLKPDRNIQSDATIAVKHMMPFLSLTANIVIKNMYATTGP